MTTSSAKSSICVAMLVRDDAEFAERAIASVLPVVDCYVVVDMGAEDDMAARLRRALSPLPGEVRRASWGDPGSARTELVTAARRAADWVLLLDPDTMLEADRVGIDAIDDLDADVAFVWVDDGHRSRVPCLLRSDKDWYFEGSVHERLSCRQVFTSANLDHLRLVRHGGARAQHERLSSDLRLLHGDLARDPDNPRTLFFLAQTLRDLGESEQAIDRYRRRLVLGGRVDELFYAHYQIGLLLEATSPEESADALLSAWETTPERAEPLYHLARHNRVRSRHHVAWSFARQARGLPLPDEGLFLEPWVYQCGVPFELADAAWRMGEERLARDIVGGLLAAGPDRLHLPPEHRSHLELIAGQLEGAS